MNATTANETAVLCAAVVDSFADRYMVWIRVVQILISIAVVPPALLSCLCIIRAGAVHINMRILLVNLFISVVLANLGVAVIAIYHLVAFIMHQNEEQLCDLMAISATSCARVNALNNYAGLTTVIGLSALAAERIYATVCFKTYESTRKLQIGIGLTIAQWLISFPTLPIRPTSDQRYPVCQGVLSRPRDMFSFMGAMLAVELFSLFIFVALVFANEKKIKQYKENAVLQRLSARYQLKENVNTTKLMIPISVVSCIVFCLSLFALLFLVHDLPRSVELTEESAKVMTDFARWMELIRLAAPLSTIAFCAAVLYSPHIRHAAKLLLKIDRWPGGRPIQVYDVAIEAEHTKNVYFEALRKQWGAA
uniref:G-protein coupled receptors family 1 profile domain-containing protein n=1 Tax=Plectus sambesii TaxID=2011161 RepID=A0A914WZ07_9BILA